MRFSLLDRIEKLNKNRRQRKWWQRLVRSMAMVVVFCTTYALILPAITMSEDPVCGLEEHVHEESCYVYQEVAKLVCQPEPGILTVHSHSSLCYDDQGALRCSLPEITEHVHGDSCYTRPEEPQCGLVHIHSEECTTWVQELTCPMEETQGHIHGEGCELVCTLPEVESHFHDETCGEECGQPEIVGHTHGDGACELVCTLPEVEPHFHDEACYEMVAHTCGETTIDGHVHEDACYPVSMCCTREEVILHRHGDACRDADGNLTCTLREVQAHSHEESCVAVSEDLLVVLTCTKEEHIHTEACYPVNTEEDQSPYFCGAGEHTHVATCFDESGELICTIPEHAHTDLCLVEVDLSADVETAGQWEATLTDVILTENWPQDLLAIANTQRNYQESEKNLILAEDGSLKGYTRYGAWAGDAYGDWNTYFVAFCLRYAGINEFPVALDHDQWAAKLKAQERYLPAGDYIPKPGDLVFLDWDQHCLEDGTLADIPVDVDQVGILEELVPPDQEGNSEIRIIAGDVEGRVDEISCVPDTPVIVGYGILPDCPTGKYACGMTNHTHCWLCQASDGTYTCYQEEHLHSEECAYRTLRYENDTLMAVMKIDGYPGIPDDLSLFIVPVTEETDLDTYGAMVSAVGDTMADTAYYVDDAVFYRVELLSEDQPYVLPADVRSSLEVTLQAVFADESVTDFAQVRTFALQEDNTQILPITEELPDETIPETETEEIFAASGEESEIVIDAGGPMLMMATMDDTSAAQTFALTGPEPEETIQPSYQAVALAASGEPESQISFTTDNASVFGIALADTTTTTGYWKRVTSTADLTSDGTYLIVSAEGNYALGYNESGTKVYMDAIKANEDYFHITTTNATDGATINLPAAYWEFNGSGNTFSVINQTYTSYYLEVSSSYATRQYRSSSYSDRDGMDEITLTYLPREGAWTFWDDNYYMINSGSTSFDTSNKSTDDQIKNRTMLIFKLVNDSLQIPSDVVTSPDSGSSGTDVPNKPTYPGYRDVSGEKIGDTSYEVTQTDGVQGKYYSDPASSKLETHFSGDTDDDGVVHSDKSVIYGDDDYDAFTSYAPNTFGVTLSALGQEFISGQQDFIKTPVDVMFILDISGSMNSEKVPGSSTKTRSMAMVEAVNETIAEIMSRNPLNRVGAVLYSSGTGNLLELGRYTEANGNYLEMRQGSWNYDNGTMSGSFIYPNDTLYVENGPLYKDNGTYPYQFNGTYIQAGIALGAQKLMAVQDIMTEATVFEGTVNETTVKVRRQPVIILLSDGEPTHSTSNYKDVLSGPHYGDGLASSNAYRGVHGYYTILSANYYKRMVGIHYRIPAKFYSVGMGINATGTTPSSSSDDAYYKRAVLDPTVARVNAANTSSTYNAANTSKQMYQLLNNTYSGNYITVTTGSQSYMPDWMGQVHGAVPVIKNPYYGNYTYTDGAYFGNYDAEELADTFGEILDKSETISPYGFVLRNRTSLIMEDPIGEGMTVVGNPVLRYGGTNYHVARTEISDDGKTVYYYYDGFYDANDGSGETADLSKITVSVTTDDNGLQTLRMDVPDYVLPAYAPYTEGFKSDGTPYFYYEALPIRLIYQVGLTESSEQRLQELYQYGGTEVFYTNRYTDTIAQTHLIPTADNPYYMKNASLGEHENCHHTNKASNPTGTTGTSFECHHALTSLAGQTVPKVTQKLGNNGKLVFTAERKVIDIPVEKHWPSTQLAQTMDPVEIRLYRVFEDTATYVTSLTLGRENNWKGVFQRLPILPEGSFYAVTEVEPQGFYALYNGESVKITIDGKSVLAAKVNAQNPVVTDPVLVENQISYILPETGGRGTSLFTFGGWFMITAACVYFVILIGRKIRKGGVY